MKLNKGDMPDIEILSEPELIQPTVIAAFSGWSDAGEAATSALRFLSRRWKAELFAQLDPEEYYDFTQTRPHVKIENGEGKYGSKIEIKPADKYHRETFFISVHTRNLATPQVKIASSGQSIGIGTGYNKWKIIYRFKY